MRADHSARDGAAPLALLPIHGGRFQVCKISFACSADFKITSLQMLHSFYLSMQLRWEFLNM